MTLTSKLEILLIVQLNFLSFLLRAIPMRIFLSVILSSVLILSACGVS